MKLRRFGALALTLALALSLLTVPASAVTFTDLPEGHWAKEDAEYLAGRSIFNGVGNGTFVPDGVMTTLQAVILGGRAAELDAVTKARIQADREQEVKALLPDDVEGWAWRDMALCLELGVLSHDELAALCASGRLNAPITRENIMFYLVRAMQMEPLAKSLKNYALEFPDADEITPALRPYVYLLTNYGVIRGVPGGDFGPGGLLSRDQMAVALRRAIDVMEREGVVVDLPNYTDYDFISGVITGAETAAGGTELTLNSEIAGVKTVEVAAEAPVYAYNLAGSHADLEVGEYARVKLDAEGEAEAVFLGGTLTGLSGAVAALSGDSITLNRGGGARSVLTIDRYTQVKAGTGVGGPEVIDPDAGYDTASCKVDELGHLVALTLSGGTTREKGLLSAVTAVAGGWEVELNDFTGRTYTYTVPAGGAVTADGKSAVLSANYVGCFAELRVAESGVLAESVALDTGAAYVQGAVKGITYRNGPRTLTITDAITGRTKTYDLADGAAVTYEGEPLEFEKLKSGSFATVRIEGGKVAELMAWPGEIAVEGTVTDIRFDTDNGQTVFTVTDADGVSALYRVDMGKQPTVYREERSSAVANIRKGDTVKITLRYHEITRIDASAPEANVTGTISSVSFDGGTGGAVTVTMKVTLPSGAVQTYVFDSNVAITDEGRDAGTEALKVGAQAAMVVDAGKVLAVNVTRAENAATKLTGKVFYVESTRNLVIRYTDAVGAERTVKVTTTTSTRILDQETGNTLSLSKLVSGEAIEVRGKFDDEGVFKATIIIR